MIRFAHLANTQQFSDVSEQAGLHRNPTRAWGNPLWGDLNNDGLLDLLVPNHELQLSAGPYIYLNNGDGTFADVISTSGVGKENPDTQAWQGISVADYDGDGNLDIFISEHPFQSGGNAPTRNILYKGNGDGTWYYVSDVAGLETSRNYGECSFFVDYDNDGELDIFVKNIASAGQDDAVNVLYHNNSDGTFTQVPDAGGLAEAEHGVTEGTLCSFVDYDNDCYMDVAFAGNDVSEAFYHNNGNGTFTDVTQSTGTNDGANTWGSGLGRLR